MTVAAVVATDGGVMWFFDWKKKVRGERAHEVGARVCVCVRAVVVCACCGYDGGAERDVASRCGGRCFWPRARISSALWWDCVRARAPALRKWRCACVRQVRSWWCVPDITVQHYFGAEKCHTYPRVRASARRKNKK